jgi:hypothetical protein
MINILASYCKGSEFVELNFLVLSTYEETLDYLFTEECDSFLSRLSLLKINLLAPEFDI